MTQLEMELQEKLKAVIDELQAEKLRNELLEQDIERMRRALNYYATGRVVSIQRARN